VLSCGSRRGRRSSPGRRGDGSTPARAWWAAAIEHHGLSVLPVDAEISLRSTELPPIHRDPADRLIVATALLRKMTVVTADTRFVEYGVEVEAL